MTIITKMIAIYLSDTCMNYIISKGNSLTQQFDKEIFYDYVKMKKLKYHEKINVFH